MSLEELVRERRFDWQNRRHRRALLEDELTPALVAELGVAGLLESYRSAQLVGLRGPASFLAQSFEWIVQGGES